MQPMSDELRRHIAEVNRDFFDEKAEESRREGPPSEAAHRLPTRLNAMVRELWDDVAPKKETVRTLDIGAGSGLMTRAFLQRGATVTAIDISRGQLDLLQANCHPYRDRLAVWRGDALEYSTEGGERFDIVVCRSFLHHVADYMALFNMAVRVLDRDGSILCDGDPISDRAVPWHIRKLAQVGYYLWRIRQPDVIGGTIRLTRRLLWRRRQTRWDLIEYHVVHGGIDVDAVCALLERNGFTIRVFRYFYSHSPLVRRFGEALGFENYFGLIARRTAA